MRDLLNQDRALSPALIRAGTNLLGLFIAITALFVILLSLGTFFSGNFLAGIVQLSGGLGLLLGLYLIVRLLGEAVMGLHRLNDRLMILGDDVSSVRAKPTDTPRTKTAAPRRAKAKAKTDTPVGTATPADSAKAEA